ncbi:BTAD domain-containing putative transcriptional regulator [Nonomuraea sp. SBT364]|uniref:BTAD domain-containing putative transcriptional regulator n=1 Tax=Nonomuraea sp. SBT364 TaxID=1580530 RepID=UPI00066E59BD|nr:BTAD domain-containing putative transcriptional regulator [Nonomuraea sp. SBT364]
MRFGVLGPLLVQDDGGRPVKVLEAKVRALLADLLVHEGRPVAADRLIDDLWGAEPPGNPANALQAKVSQLRRAVGRDRVAYQAPGYLLRLGPADEVDADRFLALVAGARSADPATRAARLTEALGLWRGPAYADFADEEFVRAAAHRLTEQRLAVVEEQAETRLAMGDHLLLTGELADLVARHPLRERLRAVQLRALYLAGRQSEALASYAELRHRLADELGVDPSPELVALHQAILRQDTSLGPPPGVPDRPRTNLPAQLTALIGHRQALEEIGRLLARVRLVTLIGPGGVGKTRVAVEAASRAPSEGSPNGPCFPDGVWLVELADQRGGVADIAQAVAATLGLTGDVPAGPPGPGTPRPPADRLAAALRESRILLVLDNCEQVIEPAAELADLLLRAAPGVKVLATSREPLGLTGETVYPVEPLQPADAIRLFAERATASAPGFALDGGTREAVAEICRRLDGIPLALELAATRVRGLGVRELAARLENRFRVLTAGQRGAPARQQTLRAMIDWSWELLSEPERVVLRRLAVPAGGCTLDAVEAVCAGTGVHHDEVLDLVTRLVDRSLVVMADSPAGPRYRLLESVAAYAAERLREADELAGVRERHLRHYLDLAEQAEPQLRGPRQQEWLSRLDAEAANFRSALQGAVLPDAAARLATALCWWWLLRGRLSEGRRALSAVLAVAPEAAELRVLEGAFTLLSGDRSSPRPSPHSGIDAPERRGRAVWLYAYGLFHAGLPAAGEELNAQAHDLLAADEWGTAAVLGLRAMTALARGDLDAVARDGLRSAALFRELGDRWGELQTVSPLSTLAEIKGDYAEAARRQTEGLRIARELGLAAEVAARHSGLGRLALLSQDWDRARELHERARRLAVEQGYVYGEVHAVMGLALGARRSGDLDAAEAYLIRLRDELVSSAAGEHLLLVELGFTAELRGDAARAADCQLRGLEVARSIGEPRAVALSLEGLAGAAALSGDAGRAESAALLLGAADAARRSVGAPLPPAERGDVDRIMAVTRAVLGEAAHADAFLRGTELPPHEAAHVARTTLSDAS